MVPAGSAFADELCALSALPTLMGGCCGSELARGSDSETSGATRTNARLNDLCCCTLQQAPTATTTVSSDMLPVTSTQVAIASAPLQPTPDTSDEVRTQLTVSPDARGPPPRSLLALRTSLVI